MRRQRIERTGSKPEVARQALVDLRESTDYLNWKKNEGWKDPEQLESALEEFLQDNNCPNIRAELEALGINEPIEMLKLEEEDIMLLELTRDEQENLNGALAVLNEPRPPTPHFQYLWQLHGVKSEEFDRREYMVSINLSNNNLKGEFPMTMFKLLATLEYYNFSRNPRLMQGCNIHRNTVIGQLVHHYNNLSNLTLLDLRAKGLSGDIPDLTICPQLESLNLSFNQLSGGIPQSLCSLSKLVHLRLEGNQLEGEIPLGIILLKSTRPHVPVPQVIPKKKKVKLNKLDFSKCLATCMNPAKGIHHRACPNHSSNREILQAKSILRPNSSDEEKSAEFPEINVSLTGNGGDGDNIRSGGCFSLPSLEQIDVLLPARGIIPVPPNEKFVSTKAPRGVLEGASSIVNLDISDCCLGGMLPWEALTSSRLQGTLHILKLSRNPFINGSIPASVGQLKVLHELYACRCGLEGSLPEELSQLIQLRVLVLADNFLKGPLPPPCLVKWTKLHRLSLQHNQLGALHSKYGGAQGLPEAIGYLKELRVLNLSHNKFKQRLPEGIGELENISELWLTDNSFFGEIPVPYGNLRRLKVINLSGNLELTGYVPMPLMLSKLVLQRTKLERPGGGYYDDEQ
jgi:Leucine-rich repeat (LRR) protein